MTLKLKKKIEKRFHFEEENYESTLLLKWTGQ